MSFYQITLELVDVDLNLELVDLKSQKLNS